MGSSFFSVYLISRRGHSRLRCGRGCRSGVPVRVARGDVLRYMTESLFYMRRENKNMLNSPIGRRAVFFSSGNIGAVAGMFPIGVEYNIGKYVVGKRRVCLLKGQKKTRFQGIEKN